jgi:hypothetical protein
MYYRYYSRDDRRFGSWVVIAVISALITAGVLYAYFSHPLPGLERRGWRQCYGHRYG